MIGKPLVSLGDGGAAVFAVGWFFVVFGGIVVKFLELVGEIWIVFGTENARNLPVFHGLESHDLSFAIDDNFDGDGLDASGGEASGDLFPKQGADLVTNNSVENTAGLLGHNLIHIKLLQISEGLLDGAFGDGVKDNAADAVGGYFEGLDEVPGDGFAFAVQIGCQIDQRGVLGDFFEGRQGLFTGG